MGFKSLLLRPLAIPVVGRGLRTIVRPVLPIFMLHRFASVRLGTTSGHHASVLRERLAYLRREKYQIVSLGDLTTGEPLSASRTPRVAITIDDGYSDFVTEAMPVFEEFDCPVTVFVATGVVDRECWYWYDKISYALSQTTETRLRVPLATGLLDYAWSNVNQRTSVRKHLVDRLKTIAERDRAEALEQIATALGVDVPTAPTHQFETMTWEDVRRCAATGLVTFGPHSVTHPPLDTVDDVRARAEIDQSWIRLNEAGAGAIPIFCYPFGAYSPREVELLSRSGMIGAVTTEYRYARADPFGAQHNRRSYTVPRIAYDEEQFHFLQAVTGIERIKLGIRLGRNGWDGEGAPPEVGVRGSELI
jgi:peptidoglycan/xylan/chitin deacetylase (PgdA/CDA1 family)